MKKNLWNIRSKLLSIIIISLFTGLIVVGYIMFNQFESYLYENIRRVLKEYVELAEQSFDASKLMQRDLQYLKQFVDEKGKAIDCRITIMNDSGEVLADSEIPIENLKKIENHLHRPEVQEAIRTHYGFSRRHSVTIDRDLLYFCKTLKHGNELTGFIRIAMFAERTNKMLSDFRYYFMISGLFVILISAISVILLSFGINRNVDKVIGFAHDIANGELDKTINIRTNDELHELGDILNKMAVKLSNFLKKLNREQQDLNTVLSSINEGLLAIGSDKKIIFYNENIFQLLDINKQNIATENYDEIIQDSHINSLLIKFFDKPLFLSDELKTENDKFLEVTITPFEREYPDSMGAVMVIKDITQYKQLEKIRRDFVANVSHEFKTPITAIRGYAESLLDWGLKDKNVNKKYMKKIIKQSQQLENLVTDLLQLANIERMQDTQLSCFSPSLIIGELLEEYLDVAEKKKITITSDFNKACPKIVGNPEMFHSILSNLIDNAIKYSHENGVVHIFTDIDGPYCIFSIKDNGIGIPQKYQKRIFERFYRVEKNRSREMGGSGLGLSIVKHIIELHNSKITVQSKVGEGTEFKFNLPV